MNDAQSDGGGGSGDTTATLKSLAKDLQKEATDSRIHEKSGPTDDGGKVLQLAVESASAIEDFNTEGRKVVNHGDGRIEIFTSVGFRHVLWPRDSEAWKGIHDSYKTVIDNLIQCAEFNYRGLNLAEVYMEQACGTLNQASGKKLAETAEGIREGSNKLTDEDVAKLAKTLTSGNTTWSVIDDASQILDPWTGRAARVFKDTYLNRLPGILVGQSVLAISLRQALVIAQAAYEGSKIDGEKLAQAAIDALDANGGAVDVNWTETLTVISRVSSLASGAAAFVPGAQTFSAVAGLVASSASAASYVVKKYEDNSADKDSKIELDAKNVDDLMDQVTKHADRIKGAVVDIEYATGDMLYELYELATSKDVVKIEHVSGEKSGDLGIELSVRQAYFEPREPGTESGYGPGLLDYGKRLDDNDKGNDPGYDDFEDTDVMGPLETGAHMAAPIYDLWHAGDTTLPAFAEEYGEAAGDVDSATAGIRDGFLRPFGGGDDGMSSGTGPLYPEWDRLHEEFLGILNGSATNLELVGKVLVAAAIAYAEQDDAAARVIEADYEDFPKI